MTTVDDIKSVIKEMEVSDQRRLRSFINTLFVDELKQIRAEKAFTTNPSCPSCSKKHVRKHNSWYYECLDCKHKFLREDRPLAKTKN